MFCPNCGKEIEENSAFCSYCGRSFAKIQQSWQPVQGTQPVPSVQSGTKKKNGRLFVGGLIAIALVIAVLVGLTFFKVIRKANNTFSEYGCYEDITPMLYYMKTALGLDTNDLSVVELPDYNFVLIQYKDEDSLNGYGYINYIPRYYYEDIYETDKTGGPVYANVLPSYYATIDESNNGEVNLEPNTDTNHRDVSGKKSLVEIYIDSYIMRVVTDENGQIDMVIMLGEGAENYKIYYYDHSKFSRMVDAILCTESPSLDIDYMLSFEDAKKGEYAGTKVMEGSYSRDKQGMLQSMEWTEYSSNYTYLATCYYENGRRNKIETTIDDDDSYLLRTELSHDDHGRLTYIEVSELFNDEVNRNFVMEYSYHSDGTNLMECIENTWNNYSTSDDSEEVWSDDYEEDEYDDEDDNTLFKISSSTVEDYSKNLDPDEYYSYDSGIGSFNFYYPAHLFNRVEKESEDDFFDETVTFYGSKGSQLTFSVAEKNAGSDIADITNYYHSNYEGSWDETSDIIFSPEDGKIVMTGANASSRVYVLVKVDEDYIYIMESIKPMYKNEDERKMYAYVTENEYRMCGFSGSSKWARSWEEYLAETE